MSMSTIKLCTAVFLIAFIVFPCVSAEDDLIRLQALNINATNDDGIHAAPQVAPPGIDIQLDRMLEEHNTFQVGSLYFFSFRLFFCFLAASLLIAPAFRLEMQPHGSRAPPLSL